MLRTLEVQATEFYDCNIKLSRTRLDALQLRTFADAQMPATGIGEVPWSTPLSSDQLCELAVSGRAEFVTAHMMLAADAEPPLIGTGVLIRSPDKYPNPRMIIVVDSESRSLGLGSRIANELLKLLNSGETVEAEVQLEHSNQHKTERFFERLGFSCVNKQYRTGYVPEYVDGALKGSVERVFALYAFTAS
ncbi:MAG: GNAT family N-acetyltransferase [Halioglobus sp.]|nr:GNAT family N-acetyltransferase [Halioglobus sp.]